MHKAIEEVHSAGRSSQAAADHTSTRAWPGHVDLRCLWGDHGDWANSTVVVPAVYKEWHGGAPPAYLHQQYPVFLYQRLNASQPCLCANSGYESGVYFQFLAQHYNRLPAYVAFIQADWIFETKTKGGHAFTFWQPKCAQQGLPWSDYMPLGGRRSVWPPRCVVRPTSWYSRMVHGNGALVEACARELLRILNVPVAVRPYNRSSPLVVTFYSNMNFLVSRRRLRYYSHAAWRTLAHRFTEEGVCLPASAPGGQLKTMPGDSTAAPNETDVGDAPRFAKVTLGMTTEFLQQTIFNFNPLEGGPNPAAPLDAAHCESPANTHC